MLSMAKAQYCLAKQEKSPEKMLEALTMTQRALRLAPSDKTTLYDIALIQQSYAQLVSDRQCENRTIGDIKNAMAGLGTAKGYVYIATVSILCWRVLTANIYHSLVY